MWGAHWSIHLEKQGIPVAYIVDEPFKADVQISCDKEGMPLLRQVIVSHPCGEVTDEQLPEVMSHLIKALISPLSDEEQFPKTKK